MQLPMRVIRTEVAVAMEGKAVNIMLAAVVDMAEARKWPMAARNLVATAAVADMVVADMARLRAAMANNHRMAVGLATARNPMKAMEMVVEAMEAAMPMARNPATVVDTEQREVMEEEAMEVLAAMEAAMAMARSPAMVVDTPVAMVVGTAVMGPK